MVPPTVVTKGPVKPWRSDKRVVLALVRLGRGDKMPHVQDAGSEISGMDRTFP